MRLGVSPTDSFVEFYRKYEGTFVSASTGFELADLVGHVEELTLACREAHGFGRHLLVLSEECGDAVLVYDSEKDAVFAVDFEGTDELLREGSLEPRWSSFAEFLDWYFLGNGRESI